MTSFTLLGLLRLHVAVVDELRLRGVARTNNNPVADYTEHLVSSRLGLRLAGNSSSGYDAIGSDGRRYQIKGRRVTGSSRSAELSAIRNLEGDTFDVLVAVVFQPDFSVGYAVELPREVVCELARYSKHTNSHRLVLRRGVLDDPRTVDLSARLAE